MANDNYDPTLQPNDTQLDQAVRLACAFVANGGIRLEQDKIDNAQTFTQLANLIDGLYGMLDDAYDKVLTRVLRDADSLMDAVERREGNPPAHK